VAGCGVAAQFSRDDGDRSALDRNGIERAERQAGHDPDLDVPDQRGDGW
jgi:hypothetical protein